jgi:ABC-type branched-subunit amino acid transport system substrate-binding protein
MKKYQTIAFMAILVFGMVGTSSVTAAPASQDALGATIKVGVLAAISGDLESIGAGITDGIKAAAMEINASSDFSFDIVLQIEDSKVDPTVAVAAYDTLKAAGVELVIGATGSAASLAVAEKTATDEIVQISYSSTSAALTNASYDYFYRTVPSDAFQGKALQAVLDDAGYGKIVIVNRGDAWGSGLAAGVKDLVGAANVVDTIEYPDATKDFASVVSSVKAADGADAILMISFTEDGRSLVTELRESGVTLPIVGTDGTADGSIVDLEKAPTSAFDFNNSVHTKPHAAAAGEGNFDGYKAALTACKTASLCSDDDPTRIYGDTAYDALWVGALAVKAAGDYDGPAIKAAMAAAGLGYVGASGNKTFDEFGDPTVASYDVTQFQGEDLVTIGTWDPINGVVKNSDARANTWSADGRPSTAPAFELFVAMLAIGTIVTLRKRK